VGIDDHRDDYAVDLADRPPRIRAVALAAAFAIAPCRGPATRSAPDAAHELVP